RLAAAGDDLPHGRVRLRRRAMVVDDHAGAAARELEGDGPPHPLRRTRDQRPPAAESHRSTKIAKRPAGCYAPNVARRRASVAGSPATTQSGARRPSASVARSGGAPETYSKRPPTAARAAPGAARSQRCGCPRSAASAAPRATSTVWYAVDPKERTLPGYARRWRRCVFECATRNGSDVRASASSGGRRAPFSHAAPSAALYVSPVHGRWTTPATGRS